MQQGDFAKSIECLKDAAAAGHVAALVDLGDISNQWNQPDVAIEWWSQAANLGSVQAMLKLGALHDALDAPELALRWLRRAATAGDARGMLMLGTRLIEQGDVVAGRGHVWMAASLGDLDAMVKMGVEFMRLGDAVEDALEWWHKAADAGHHGAMFNLGIYLKDQGELEQASTWFSMAAVAGNAEAKSILDTMSQRGRTEFVNGATTEENLKLGLRLLMERKYEEALPYFRASADAGNADAMRELGMLLVKRGEPANGLNWIQKASSAGDVAASGLLRLIEAQRQLGL